MFSSYKLMEFGNKLQQIRKDAKLTQSAVHDLTGLSEETIRRMESGKVIPKYETLETLSNAYKHDLLDLLKTYRKHVKIFDFYNDLDTSIMTTDLPQIKLLMDNIKQLKSDSLTPSLINSNEFSLLESFLQCTICYYDNEYSEFEKLITTLISSLNLSIYKFSLSNFEANTYNPLEIRVLLLISLILIRKNDIEFSTKIMKFCLDYMLNYSNETYGSTKLISKLYYNLSYNYHLLDQQSQVLRYSNLGIEYTIKNSSFYCLPYLYSRKSIAQFKLGDKEYKRTLKKAIGLLQILGDKETAKSIQETAEKMYEIKLNTINLD
ncbi:MAG: helix-turn-helix domain-containing protein [Alkaliphilus sp.]